LARRSWLSRSINSQEACIRHGGRTIEAAIAHLDADPLVFLGWAPGDARSTLPLSHAEFVQKMREWVDKGTACPA
jgi:hypothetical protein